MGLILFFFMCMNGPGIEFPMAGYPTRDKSPKEKSLMTEQLPILWFFGLSGSGKTTLSKAVATVLTEQGTLVESLDGDVLRDKVTKGLGFTKEGRDKNIQIAIELAKQMSDQQKWVLATFITPYEYHRTWIKERLPGSSLIYVNASLDVCESRDVKGLYKKARCGEVKHFTGISDPFDPPKTYDLEVKTSEMGINECVDSVMDYVSSLKSKSLHRCDLPASLS
jgi:adenylylsulfate kinase